MTNPGVDDQVWHNWALERSANGALEGMVSSELYDHTWAASGMQIIKGLQLRGDERILEAGSGWGRLIHAVKTLAPKVRIDGIELTKELSDRSRSLLAQHGMDSDVKIHCADLLKCPIEESAYDAAYSSRVLHYIDDKQLVINKLFKGLKGSGRLMIILPNRSCPYRWLSYRHAPLYPIRGLGKMMKNAGFSDIRFGGFGFFPPSLRASHKSAVPKIDQILSNSPLSRFAGLAFVTGVK
jgi:protein-L-isoaspartate O-methyltransferase